MGFGPLRFTAHCAHMGRMPSMLDVPIVAPQALSHCHGQTQTPFVPSLPSFPSLPLCQVATTLPPQDMAHEVGLNTESPTTIHGVPAPSLPSRSEERRVGKEGRS